jgi:RNA polymerase II subunit A C-terminal domain phosphatase
VNGSPGHSDDDSLRSPLAKRKKLAAERAGYSRLKDSISANDIVNKNGSSSSHTKSKSPSPMEEYEEDSEEEEEEEDFLAKEFNEEDWG